VHGPQHDKHVSGWAPMPERRLWSSCGKQVILNIKVEIQLPPAIDNSSLVLLDLTNVVWTSQRCSHGQSTKEILEDSEIQHDREEL
jgi:hypothetical protein